jgi:hypothetical protein
MIKKIIIIILSALLIWMLAQSFMKLFQWDIEFGEPEKKWVKIIHVKIVKKTIRVGNRVGMSANLGSYDNWVATVKHKDGRTSIVEVIYGPKPQKGNCMPVIASELSNGNVYTLLDIEQWRFGTQYGTCD